MKSKILAILLLSLTLASTIIELSKPPLLKVTSDGVVIVNLVTLDVNDNMRVIVEINLIDNPLTYKLENFNITSITNFLWFKVVTFRAKLNTTLEEGVEYYAVILILNNSSVESYYVYSIVLEG